RVREGCFLAVDYGADTATLARRFPFGSLRAYFQHQVFDGMECYRRAGRQDLTVDVNFTHLSAWMSEFGWQCTSHQTQMEFISRYVPHQVLQADDFVTPLMSESGAGQAFKVACFQPV
ncbi:MAG: SAM-dependent methyltransferase, partial [Candidatus Methylacidiphilales bacterium]